MSQRFVSLLRIILGPRGRYVLCWLLALGITGAQYYVARHVFSWHEEAKRRADGNLGHTLIDFGGQWLSGRMIATGHGREMYSRPVQWAELEAAYPRADEFPGQNPGDAERLFAWMADLSTGASDEGPYFPPDPKRPRTGGPLYPPTHAVLFAPFGLLQPRPAYHLMQVLTIGLTWLAGAALVGVSRGRMWWPVATTYLMLFPGYQGAIGLGQNSIVSVTILVAGWYFVVHGRDWTGGMVWGLLAYKPVWAVAFLLVPLLTRRWRMLAGMIVGGTLFGLVTLPIVGIQPWLDWLRIGQEANRAYNVTQNWIFLSRDLLGIPRRWLLEFQAEVAVHDRPIAAVLGWSLWFAVVGVTAALALARRRDFRQVEGYGAAFIGIGAWASCLHFIYYDVTLAALPVALLLTDPRRFLRPAIVAAAPAPPALAGYLAPRPLREPPPEPTNVPAGPRSVAVVNSAVLTFVAALFLIEQTFNNLALDMTASFARIPSSWPVPNSLKFSTQQHGTPFETFVLLGLWAYCGARVLLGELSTEQGGESGADIRGTHQ